MQYSLIQIRLGDLTNKYSVRIQTQDLDKMKGRE